MPPAPRRTYELVTNRVQLGEALLACIISGTISIDTETTGLNIHEAGFASVGIVLADRPDHAYYLPIGHEGFQGTSSPLNLDRDEVTRTLEQIFRECHVIYHNGAYDRPVLKRTMDLDFDLTLGDDTLLAGHLVDENMPNSLKVRAKRFLGIDEVSPKIADVDKERLKSELLEAYSYEATATNGRKYAKTGYKLRPDWVEKLKAYYLRFSKGATPYKFVTGMLGKAYQVMKENGVEGVDFKGVWRGDFRHVPPEIAVYYACDDAMNTLSLWQHYRDGFFAVHPELLKLYEQIELPVNDVMMRATYRGMRANREHLEQMKETLQRRKEEFQEEALDLAQQILSHPDVRPAPDPDGFKVETLLTSAKQLQQLLFSVLRFPEVGKTKAGAPSADKDALKKLQGLKARTPALTELGHRFIDAKLKFQDVAKLENTYTDSLAEKIDAFGRIHAGYNTVGTVSGRMSSSNPNFQQMPRLTPEEVAAKPWLYGIDVRAAFTSEPGYVFVTAD